MILFFSGKDINWASVIESGKKIHTARRLNREVKDGTRLQLVVDRFRPTRRTVLDTTCVSTQRMLISGRSVAIDGKILGACQLSTLARNGGFETVEQMLGYYGNSYIGTIIHWTKKRY